MAPNSGETLIRKWIGDAGQTLAWLAARFLGAGQALLEVQASRLRFRRIPDLFARDLTRISPRLNEDLLDLYGRSGLALLNRFGFFNRAHDFGGEIDWQHPESPAWLAELHSFDFALDLALTFRISREEPYARQLRYLIVSWIAANPPGLEPGWKFRPLTRRIRNWILASDLARDDWSADAEFLALVADNLSVQAAFLHGMSKKSCASAGRAAAARALVLAGRFFDSSVGEEQTQAGFSLLDEDLSDALRGSGHYSDADPYRLLELAQCAMECLVAAVPAEARKSHPISAGLRDLLELLEGILLPDGTLPLFGPGATASAEPLADLFALGAVVYERPVWKSLAGSFGILPYMLLGDRGKAAFDLLPEKAWKTDTRSFPASGYYRLASRVDRGSVLVIKGRSTSSHLDPLTFELSLAGGRAVVDSGAFLPEDEPGHEPYSLGRAHNLLLVDDGEPEMNSQPPAPRTIRGSAGYIRWTGLCFTDFGTMKLGIRHSRAFYLLEDSLWAVLDSLSGKGHHRITSLLHLYSTFEADLAGGRAVLRSRSAAFSVLPFGSAESRFVASKGESEPPSGWFSPEFATRYPALSLAVEWNDAPLPWIGGYVIAPSAKEEISRVETDASGGAVRLEISGKRFELYSR